MKHPRAFLLFSMLEINSLPIGMIPRIVNDYENMPIVSHPSNNCMQRRKSILIKSCLNFTSNLIYVDSFLLPFHCFSFNWGMVKEGRMKETYFLLCASDARKALIPLARSFPPSQMMMFFAFSSRRQKQKANTLLRFLRGCLCYVFFYRIRVCC